MIIAIDLPHVFYPGASQEENAVVLRILLEHLIAQNRAFLERHPNAWPGLDRSPVRYGRTRVWDSIPALLRRGYGDCKTLSAALIAELRNQGVEAIPTFRFMPNADGSLDFHILVQTRNGFRDPSKEKGMGGNENIHFQRSR